PWIRRNQREETGGGEPENCAGLRRSTSAFRSVRRRMKSPFASLILLDELVTLKTASMLSEGGRWPASPKPSHTVRRFRRLGCDAPPFVRSIPGPRPLARVPVRRSRHNRRRGLFVDNPFGRPEVVQECGRAENSTGEA